MVWSDDPFGDRRGEGVNLHPVFAWVDAIEPDTPEPRSTREVGVGELSDPTI